MLRNGPNHKGNVAELKIAAAAVELGIEVSKPLVEHCRYDLIFDLGPRLMRVQCKWAPRHGDVVVVGLTGFRFTANGSVRTAYTADEIDASSPTARSSTPATCFRLNWSKESGRSSSGSLRPGTDREPR